MDWISLVFLLALFSAFFIFGFIYRAGKFLQVLSVALIGRISIAVLQEHTRILGNADIVDYEHHFIRFSNALESGSLIEYVGVHVPFYNLLYPGWIYSAGFENPIFLIRITNALISILVIVPLNQIKYQVTGSDFKNWHILIILFWPTYIRFTSMVGRTPVVVLATLSFIAVLLMITESISIIGLLTFILLGFCMVMLRIHHIFYILFMVVGINIISIFRKNDRISKNSILTLIPVGISVTGFIIYDRTFENSRITVNQVVEMAQGRVGGNSDYLLGIYPDHFFDLVWYAPLQGFYFLFSPMPWDVYGLSSAVASAEAWILLFGMGYIIYRYKTALIQNWELGTILLMVSAIALGFGMVTKNAGAAARWRLPLTLLLITVIIIVVSNDTIYPEKK